MAIVVVTLQGSAAARSWGKRRKGPRGFYPLPWFGLGRSEVSGPREPVAAGRGALGSSAAELGRRRAAAEVAVVLGGKVEGPFIGAARRWSGRGALVPAGELRGAPLMAFGVAARGSAIRGGDATAWAGRTRKGGRARGGAGCGARRRAERCER